MPGQPPSGPRRAHALERTFVDAGSGPAACARVFFALLGLVEASGRVGGLPPLRDTHTSGGRGSREHLAGCAIRSTCELFPPWCSRARCVKCPSLKCAINLRCWNHARAQPLPVSRTHQRQVCKNVDSLRGGVACRRDESFH